MADYIVTTLVDENGTGADLSLREALALANADPGADTITFDPALTGGGTAGVDDGFITLGGTHLVISNDVTIDGDVDGDGSPDITISGSDVLRVLEIESGGSITATLNGLVIRDGRADSGGGIRVGQYDALVLTNSTLADNFATAFGGGIANSGTAALTNVTLSNNDGSLAFGGGIANFGMLVLTNVTITESDTGEEGGGIFNGHNSTAFLTNVTLSGNTASGNGGGLLNTGTAVLNNVTVTGNTASLSGGGISNTDDLTLTNTAVWGNTTFADGGGLHNDGSALLENITVTGNSADDEGGGIFNETGATVTLANSIVAGNGDSLGSPDVGGATTLYVGTNLLSQGAGAVDVADIFVAVTTIDPNHIPGDGDEFDAGVLAQNGGPVATVAIRQDGAAHDTGSDPALPLDPQDLDGDTVTAETLPVDARGAPRVAGTQVDVGAFELQPTPANLIVTTLADGGDDDFAGGDIFAETNDGGGLSLREALALANGDPDANTITFDACLCDDTVTLDGTGLTISSNVTIDGDVDGDNRADIAIDANGYSGVFHVTSGTATLDALIISGGYADRGAGVRIESGADLTIANAVVAANSADLSGGGIYNAGTVTLTSSTVEGNQSSQSGGGIFNAGSALATLTNTTLSGNYASVGAGGMFNFGTATLTNSTLSGNDALFGGGISNYAALTLTNSIVAGNAASGSGAEISQFGAAIYTGVSVIGVGGDSDAADHVIQAPTLQDLFAAVADDPFTGVESGVLADNGGAVPTIAIKIGGIAQNGGDGAAAVYDDDHNAGTPDVPIATDARGFDRVAASGVDIGAFEQQAGQSLVVTTLEDQLDSLDPNATLADFGGAGDLSLREALVLADQDPTSVDTITFAGALTGGGTPGVDDGTLLLTQYDLVIRGSVTIDGDVDGDGTPDITVDAQGYSRAFTALSGTSTLNGLTIVGGYAFTGGGVTVGYFGSGTADLTISNAVIDGNDALYGGGIAVDIGSSLRLVSSTVANNFADYVGGGIASKGTLTVVGSLVTANTSGYIGGGIANDATLTIVNSTLSDNRIDGLPGPYGPNAGAGLYNDGSAVVVSSTISGNHGAVLGGGIYNSSALTLVNATIANNTAVYGGGLYDSTCGCADTTLSNSTISGNYAGIGGGIYHGAGALTLTNSIVAGNGAGYSDPEFVSGGGTVTFSGVNLFSQDDIGRDGIDIHEDDLADIFAAVTTVDPDTGGTGDEFQAGLLANHGGPVATIAIKALGGKAFNAGDDSALPPDTENLDGDADSAEDLPFDARGLARISAGTVDIGAFEVQNGAPAVGANTGLTLNEGASATITAAALDFDDAEEPDTAITYTITTAPTHGVLSRNGVALGLNSTFTQADINDNLIAYAHDGGETTSASFGFSVGDGIAPPVSGQTFAFTIDPVNDAPVNILPAGPLEIEANTATAIDGLSVADAGAGSLTTTLAVAHGTLLVASAGGAAVGGSGTAAVTLTGTLAQINTTLGAIDNVVYQGTHDFFGTDTLGISTSDNGNSGIGTALTDSDSVTINLNTHLIGTPDNDSYPALPGNARIDARGGIDTLTLSFKLTEATVSHVGNQVIIDGPAGSHTVTSGFERYVFTDGTVDNNDGNPLVDDLFYYSQNHDVWNAHIEAEAHYAGWGWQERRDPSAFFSTTTYLAINADVKAANVNPLDHWHAVGWQEGRLPSLAFDGAKYLAANPDVAAAQIDPLAHFLAFGASEGREPIAPTRLVVSGGFDFVHYLLQNPDVAAAGVDPFWHFQTTGWKEGRDPNALFDTSGYLATYTDVKNAGINPLDHYNTHGWKEGRDPSLGFDTNAYLANYADVKAANINPLTHFLQAGIDESRSAFADGAWG